MGDRLTIALTVTSSHLGAPSNEPFEVTAWLTVRNESDAHVELAITSRDTRLHISSFTREVRHHATLEAPVSPPNLTTRLKPTMDHACRIEIAAMIARHLLAEQGGNLLYVGVFGSVHNDTDTDESDIDLLAVMSNRVRFAESGLSWMGLRFEHVVVGVGLYSLLDADAMVSTPNYRWPYSVGKFLNNRELYRVHDIQARCRELIQAISQDGFLAAARVEYLEALSGIHRLRDRGARLADIRDVRSSALKWLSRLEACIALVNRSFLHDQTSFKNVPIISALTNAPRSYAALANTIWQGSTSGEILDAAEELWGHALTFGRDNGLQSHLYSVGEGLGTLTTLAT